jgi:cardiolipin synthase
MAIPGHAGGGNIHDAYVEVAGPSATDVHHNFVQRWNEASERAAKDGVWGHDGDDDLAFPDRLSGMKGNSLVQIQRNVHAGRYGDRRPSPGAQPFDIVNGEGAIREQYLAAIEGARRSIYIENQALAVEAVVTNLGNALRRGVEIVVLLPADPEGWVGAARQKPEHKSFFDKLASLGRHENFALVGIAGPSAAGTRSNVYVHTKLMLIDDAWATIGSCNLHWNSFFGHTEMNASFWDQQVVRSLRCELLAEHLGQDTAHLDDRMALRLYRQTAVENRRRRDAGHAAWQGLAFSLNPAAYGV